LWRAQLYPRLAQHWLGFANLAVVSMVVSVFLLCFLFLRRFLYPILDPLAFAPNTFYTHNLSKYDLFQSRFQYGPFQNLGLHTCFGLNLNRGLNKTNVYASKRSFTQRTVLHKTVLSTNAIFYTKTRVVARACARAVCSLQDNSFHGGRRNTQKAVKLAFPIGFTTFATFTNHHAGQYIIEKKSI